jgi:hypothetical protein
MSNDLGSILEFSEDISDAEAPKALPSGDYLAKIVSAENGTSASSGKSRGDVTFRIAPEDFPADFEDAGEFPEGLDVHFYPSTEDNKTSRFRLRKFVEAIGGKTGGRIDMNEWIGKQAVITLESETFEGIERNRIRKVEAK